MTSYWSMTSQTSASVSNKTDVRQGCVSIYKSDSNSLTESWNVPETLRWHNPIGQLLSNSSLELNPATFCGSLVSCITTNQWLPQARGRR